MKYRNRTVHQPTFYKELMRPSIHTAIKDMYDWGQGKYEMFLIDWGSSEQIDGYLWVRLWGMESFPERELYDC